jgi:hypothetical protein
MSRAIVNTLRSSLKLVSGSLGVLTPSQLLAVQRDLSLTVAAVEAEIESEKFGRSCLKLCRAYGSSCTS